MEILLLVLGGLAVMSAVKARQRQIAAGGDGGPAVETIYPQQTQEQQDAGSQDLLGGLLGGLFGGGDDTTAGAVDPTSGSLQSAGIDIVQQGIQANLQLASSFLAAKEDARANMDAWNKAVSDTIRSGYYDDAILSGFNNYKIEQRVFQEILDPSTFGAKMVLLSEAQLQGNATMPVVNTELNARRQLLQPDVPLAPPVTTFEAERVNVAEFLASAPKEKISRFW